MDNEVLKARRARNTNIPKRFHDTVLSDYDPVRGDAHALEAVEAYADDLAAHRDAGKGLLLTGSPGAGKTMLACGVLNAARENGYSVFYLTFHDYVRYHTNGFDLKRAWEKHDDVDAYRDWKTLFDRIVAVRNSVEFLVLDDVGKEHSTQSRFAEDEFDSLLRHRYDRGLPTIMTTNMRPSSWAGTYSASMESFIHEACVLVPVDPKADYRKG